MRRMHVGSLIAAAALLLASTPALAQDLDTLWAEYQRQAETYEQLQSECDSGDRTVTRINRICREAADASIGLSNTIESLLALDTGLTAEERELLYDGLLTNRQIAGALWVELGECQQGLDILEPLRTHPELAARPLVEQATQSWLDRGHECVAAASVADADYTQPTPEISGPPIAPIALMAGGGAVLIGGLALDLAMGSKRNEFSELKDQCTTSGCTDDEIERFETLSDQLNGMKFPVLAMYAGGGAIVVAGAVWYALSGRTPDQRDVSLLPSVGRDSMGVTLRARF